MAFWKLIFISVVMRLQNLVGKGKLATIYDLVPLASMLQKQMLYKRQSRIIWSNFTLICLESYRHLFVVTVHLVQGYA